MMGVGRLTVGLSRMFVRLGRMLMASIVLAPAVVFGGGAMRFCRILVMLGGLCMFFLRHFPVPFLQTAFGAAANF
jgi:hypothetical protein